MIRKVLPIILPEDILVVYKCPEYRYYNSNWGKADPDKVKYMFVNERSRQTSYSHKIH